MTQIPHILRSRYVNREAFFTVEALPWDFSPVVSQEFWTSGEPDSVLVRLMSLIPLATMDRTLKADSVELSQ